MVARPAPMTAPSAAEAGLRLGRLSLRAKAVIAFGAVAAYFLATALIVDHERMKLTGIVEQLESLNEVESSVARVNLFASHAMLKINENYFVAEPPQIVDAIDLDVQSMSAGMGGLREWVPGADAMTARLDAALAAARASSARSAVIEVRSAMHEIASALGQLTREVRARHESVWASYRATYDAVTLIAASLSVVGLAIFGGLVMVFFRRLAGDLRLLAERAVDVVRGYRGDALTVTRGGEEGRSRGSPNHKKSILRSREQQIELARQQRFHQEKMVAIGSLAAAVAHEINNPIAAIEGVAQSIQSVRSHECPSGGAHCHPDLILQHTRRIVGITRQLSELTSPQSTQPEWTDLNALARGTASFVSYDPRMRGVRLDLALDASIPAVWAVPDHVTQVLMNLLINAADALAGAPERRIAVATAADGDFVKLSLADTGCGMDAPTVERAFDEGFTTKGERGSGIGLFLCKTLIERGGGRIALESGAGRGTTVILWLPIHGGLAS